MTTCPCKTEILQLDKARKSWLSNYPSLKEELLCSIDRGDTRTEFLNLLLRKNIGGGFALFPDYKANTYLSWENLNSQNYIKKYTPPILLTF